MKINIKATNLELTPSIKEYIQIKIGSLGRFLKKFETKGEIEVFVEIGRSTKHHHKGNVFYSEVTFSLGKKILRAEHLDSEVRVAIDKVKDKLQKEIKKYKEMRVERYRKNRKREV